MENVIDKIKEVLGKADLTSVKKVKEISSLIRSAEKIDFSKIKDGEHFTYKGREWIRLGEEQGGVLCITAKVWKELAFDKNGCNDYRKSSVRKAIEEQFLPNLDADDLLPYEMDLTADNGDDAYGKCKVSAGILSCDLYRKYRKFIPLFKEWMWTCTAWNCSPDSGSSHGVRRVDTAGGVGYYDAYNSYGVVPACIFKI